GLGAVPLQLDLQSVQVSRDGQKLVVVARDTGGSYQVYLADKQFQTVTQLTSDTNYHADATFSVDGTQIVFVASNPIGSGNQLFTVPTKAPYTVTEISSAALGALDTYDPVFTPDGKSLVFVSETGD